MECRTHTLDEFWRNIFYNCAINKFPKGVRYDNTRGNISIKHDKNGKSRVEYFTLQTDNSEELYNQLIHIFKELLEIRSEYDINISKKEFDEIRKLNDIDMDTEWKKLKPKSIKSSILMSFVSREGKNKGLDIKRIKKIYNQIQLGFQFKYINNDDVNYKKGIIYSINGFVYDDETKNYNFTNKKSIYRVEKQINKTNYFQQCMDRWIKDYKTSCII
jgi:hypothetical protein